VEGEHQDKRVMVKDTFGLGCIMLYTRTTSFSIFLFAALTNQLRKEGCQL